ncbi:MAG: hypothetical protein IJL32_08345 [Oscillospiraceae bacterium]|nr:hypothetical protein [Oscillospiraceae bacterium]
MQNDNYTRPYLRGETGRIILKKKQGKAVISLAFLRDLWHNISRKRVKENFGKRIQDIVIHCCFGVAETKISVETGKYGKRAA